MTRGSSNTAVICQDEVEYGLPVYKFRSGNMPGLHATVWSWTSQWSAGSLQRFEASCIVSFSF